MKFVKIKWTPADSAGIIVCLLLTAATVWLGFAPIWQRHANFLNEQHELESQKQQNSHQELVLLASKKHLALTQAELEKVPLHLQPTGDLNQRLASVTDLAAHSHLRIEDITPGATTRGIRFDTVTIHLAGEGTYPACAAFLHHLKQSMPDIGIRTLHIYSQGTTGNDAKFAFDLQWFAAPSPSVATVQ
jgi:Tfp pilus assembly protein PilO